MKVNVIKSENNEIILEFETNDYTIPDLVAGQLLQSDDVEFAGVNKEHPEVGRPTLVLKTGKKKAASVLSKAIDELDESISELRSQIPGKK